MVYSWCVHRILIIILCIVHYACQLEQRSYQYAPCIRRAVLQSSEIQISGVQDLIQDLGTFFQNQKFIQDLGTFCQNHFRIQELLIVELQLEVRITILILLQGKFDRYFLAKLKLIFARIFNTLISTIYVLTFAIKLLY